jgi:hypothetical protein
MTGAAKSPRGKRTALDRAVKKTAAGALCAGEYYAPRCTDQAAMNSFHF